MSSINTLAVGDGECASKAEFDASIAVFIITEGGGFAGEEAGQGGAVGVGVAEAAGRVEEGAAADSSSRGPGDEAAGGAVAVEGGEGGGEAREEGGGFGPGTAEGPAAAAGGTAGPDEVAAGVNDEAEGLGRGADGKANEVLARAEGSA